MERIIILYDFLSDSATLSGGDWQLPLSNMQNEKLYKVARSASTDLADTQFNVSLTTLNLTKSVVLDNTNVSPTAKYRVTAYQNDGVTVMYTSGWLDVVEPFPFGTVEYGAPYLYDGFTGERGNAIIHVLDEPVLASKWKIEIDDLTNGAGVVDIGRLVIGKFVQPSVNYQYGSGLSFSDNSVSAKTLSGGTVHWRRKNPRIFRFAFDYIKDAVAFLQMYDLNRAAGFDDQVYVIPDPELRDTRLYHRSFLGVFRAQDAITQAVYGHSSAGYEIEEVIL